MRDIDNTTTSYQSLLAFVGMILSEDKETFKHYYRIASHGEGDGNLMWYYMSDEFSEYMGRKNRKNQQKLRQKRKEAKREQMRKM